MTVKTICHTTAKRKKKKRQRFHTRNKIKLVAPATRNSDGRVSAAVVVVTGHVLCAKSERRSQQKNCRRRDFTALYVTTWFENGFRSLHIYWFSCQKTSSSKCKNLMIISLKCWRSHRPKNQVMETQPKSYCFNEMKPNTSSMLPDVALLQGWHYLK